MLRMPINVNRVGVEVLRRRQLVAFARRNIIKLFSKLGQRDRSQAVNEQRFRFAHGIKKRRINHLLYRAVRVITVGADGENARSAYGVVYIQQRYAVQITGDAPAAVVPLFRLYIARLTKARHSAPHHGSIGAQHGANLL